MQVTLFGATGKVGRLVIKKALEKDMTIVAFVHTTQPDFANNPRIKLIAGDIHNPADISRAIEGSDVVVSTLSSWGTKDKDILTTCMTHLIPAMEHAGIKRIISLTGADAFTPKETPNTVRKLTHKLFSLLAPKVMQDGEKHMALLSQSSLDATIIRSPVMTDEEYSGYELQSAPLKPWATIPRSCVANAIVNLLFIQDFIRQAPFIAKK